MDQQLQKIQTTANFFVIFIAFAVMFSFLAVRIGLYTAGEAGVLMAGLSTLISAMALRFVIINTANQLK